MNTKIAIKSDKLTPFGGIFYVLDQFDRFIGRRVDTELGLRCAFYGYQYSEIFRALFSVFLCGGTSIEDINAYLKDDLLSRPNTMVPSSDTILKGISELATDNIEYSSSKNNTYSFNPATKLNDLMVKLLLGVTTINGLTVHIENRDGNTNVRFMQEETLKRMFANLENNGLKIRRFCADCGSYTQKVVTCALKHAEFIYIRAERCASLYEKVKKRTDWETVEINNEIYQVRSFPFDSFEGVEHCRLVVQRQKRKSNEQMDLFDGEYTYRCILTNDWNMEDEQVIRYYNERGTSERVFDQMNNDFGWSSLWRYSA